LKIYSYNPRALDFGQKTSWSMPVVQG